MQRKTKQVIFYSLIAVAMFGFAYALVPLYDVMCRALGINGKPNMIVAENTSTLDRSRTITMQFLATNNENLKWVFRPNQKTIQVHPGANQKVTYFARNDTDQTMTVQAIPSVTPSRAANHLHKTACFCFEQQTLKPHQSMNMPIVFHFDNKLPKDIHEVTMSYTLFRIKKKN